MVNYLTDIFEKIEALLKLFESKDVTVSYVDRMWYAMDLDALAFDLRVNKIPQMESEMERLDYKAIDPLPGFAEDLAKAKELEVKASNAYKKFLKGE